MAVNYFGVDNALPLSEFLLETNSEHLGFYDVQRKRLEKFAKSYIQENAVPSETLISAGSTSLTPEVVSSRRGFQDFRRMMIMTQWWLYSGDTNYRDHVINMIVDWAEVNEPDGHPINQTNFEGMHHCIPALRPYFSGSQETIIDAWLDKIRIATEAWAFPAEPGGGTLQYGNHFTHHYMQLLLCYRSLQDTTKFNALLTTIDSHGDENFPYSSGILIFPNEYTITAIDQTNKKYTILGNHASEFSTLLSAKVYLMNTSGFSDDGYKTLVSATNVGSNTEVVVSESINTGIVAGTITASYDNSSHDGPRRPYSAGESIDRVRRDALHYQIYDVQPWLEIAIAEGGNRYETLMDAAYTETKKQFFTPDFKHYEFTDSVDDFDALRYAGSLAEYLQPNSMVVPGKFCRIVFQYYQYKQSIDPTFTVQPEDVSVAIRSDILSTNWPYWFRWVLGLL